MASPAQIKYMTELAEKRDLNSELASPELRAWLNTPLALENATNQEVNLILAALKLLPLVSTNVNPAQLKPPNPAQVELAEAEQKVDKGHYFIVDPFDGEEKFFKIEKPEPPSRWAGYTFIKVQASDYFYPVKDIRRRTLILTEIAKDPINAMNEYGIRLGVCGYCGRTLTAVDSRLRGMGPICAARILGQPTPEQDDILRKLGFK
jgi:hypothetical protein